jgi:hypothetical protein
VAPVRVGKLPGQGLWPGATHVRQLQLPPDHPSGDHGRLPPVNPGHFGRRGRLIPVSAPSLHSQSKTSNRFLEIGTRPCPHRQGLGPSQAGAGHGGEQVVLDLVVQGAQGEVGQPAAADIAEVSTPQHATRFRKLVASFLMRV